MSTVITVENLGKKYTISHQKREEYSSLRDAITNSVRGFSKKIFSPFTSHSSPLSESEDFWALKDVSFEVKQGERIGIIGRNGAGKSTLLKILSRITEPTTGSIRIKGRVASLLEVGTGFHPELTGRENVYLNGAILGMGKEEIRKKFDEIVNFAEIDKFLDTPVKRYSSGMYVRLAFAVAAHLEPEILIVDEVLAVGDTAFQKKCLGKMDEVGQAGRTILFVSHNLVAVRNLCQRVLSLQEGVVNKIGTTDYVIDDYLKSSLCIKDLDTITATLESIPFDPVFRFIGIDIMQDGESTTSIRNGLPVEIVLNYRVNCRTQGLRVYFDLVNSDGNILVRSFFDDDADTRTDVEPGTYVSTAIIPAHFLAPKSYEIKLYATIFDVRCITPGGISFILNVASSGRLNRAYPNEPIRSNLQPFIQWETKSK